MKLICGGPCQHSSALHLYGSSDATLSSITDLALETLLNFWNKDVSPDILAWTWFLPVCWRGVKMYVFRSACYIVVSCYSESILRKRNPRHYAIYLRYLRPFTWQSQEKIDSSLLHPSESSTSPSICFARSPNQWAKWHTSLLMQMSCGVHTFSMRDALENKF